MTQIFHLPEDIRQEFTIDYDGSAYASQSAVARLCGIRQQSINELLEKIATGKVTSESLKPLSGIDYRGTGKKIPDIAVAAIINHYAMYARNTTDQAKKVSLCFQAIGIRTWIQNELGWQKQNPDSKFAEDLMLADYAARSAQNAGVDKDVTEQIKLESLMKAYPEKQNLLKPQKEAIAASNPLPDKPMTPTEIGELLAVKLGVEKVSAKKVNRRLLDLGYQVSITRIKRSNGKEVHDYYKATEKGKPHSQLQLSTYLDAGVETDSTSCRGNLGRRVLAKATKAQLRWFSSIVEILLKNWEEA